jgi:hypothetical protein
MKIIIAVLLSLISISTFCASKAPRSEKSKLQRAALFSDPTFWQKAIPSKSPEVAERIASEARKECNVVYLHGTLSCAMEQRAFDRKKRLTTDLEHENALWRINNIFDKNTLLYSVFVCLADKRQNRRWYDGPDEVKDALKEAQGYWLLAGQPKPRTAWEKSGIMLC